MSENQKLEEMFENRVYDNLLKCGFAVNKYSSLGVAVSGGADSISLLESLAVIGKKYRISLKVVSVNHNIREEKESLDDSLYVKERCEKLKQDGIDVTFRLVSIPNGDIAKYAEENNLGIEESAREFRYQIFETFMKDENLSFIALAHNKNDQIETLLMRFLQGSGSTGMSGIRMVRGAYIRPLLTLERKEIEEYLKSKGVSWRIDSTNRDCKYLRNRIRNVLVPVLSENFPGYDTALLNGMLKNSYDDEYLTEKANEFEWQSKDGYIHCDEQEFSTLSSALQVRVIQNGIVLLGKKLRFPFRLINEFIESVRDGKKCSVNFSEVELISDNKTIYIKNKEIVATESVFFGIIKKDGCYDFPFGKVLCRKENSSVKIILEGIHNSYELKDVVLPICIRSVQSDDKILDADGKYRAVSDILSDWHIDATCKKNIPVVQELSSCNQSITAVVGSLYGFDNWIVRG